MDFHKSAFVTCFSLIEAHNHYLPLDKLLYFVLNRLKPKPLFTHKENKRKKKITSVSQFWKEANWRQYFWYFPRLSVFLLRRHKQSVLSVEKDGDSCSPRWYLTLRHAVMDEDKEERGCVKDIVFGCVMKNHWCQTHYLAAFVVCMSMCVCMCLSWIHCED